MANGPNNKQTGARNMTHFYGIQVTVKYLGPTNYRGSRYKATIAGYIGSGRKSKFSATVAYNYDLSNYDNQLLAVDAVVKKFIEEIAWYDGFKVLAATDGNFIIDLTSSEELAA